MAETSRSAGWLKACGIVGRLAHPQKDPVWDVGSVTYSGEQDGDPDSLVLLESPAPGGSHEGPALGSPAPGWRQTGQARRKGSDPSGGPLRTFPK